MDWELILFASVLAGVTAGCLMPARWLVLPHDKLLHFGAYAVLMLAALPMAQGWGGVALWALGLALCGWLIELLQNLVPGRSFSWGDLGANLLGIAAGCCGAPLLLASN